LTKQVLLFIEFLTGSKKHYYIVARKIMKVLNREKSIILWKAVVDYTYNDDHR